MMKLSFNVLKDQGEMRQLLYPITHSIMIQSTIATVLCDNDGDDLRFRNIPDPLLFIPSDFLNIRIACNMSKTLNTDPALNPSNV